MPQPSAVYRDLLAKRAGTVDRLRERFRLLGNFRLGFFVIGLVAMIAVSVAGYNWWLLLAPFGAALIFMIAMGERLKRQIRLAGRSVTWYQQALGRTERRRNDSGETGERFADPSHPYSADLDLFGRHSLFQLLSVCRTRAGEGMLADWLLNAAQADVIRERHEAIRDLRDRLQLREDLAVLGEDFSSGVNPEALAAWSMAKPIAIPRGLRLAAAALSIVAAILLIGWVATGFVNPAIRLGLIGVGVLEAGLFYRYRHQVLEIARGGEEPGHDLTLLSAVLARLQQESFATDGLRRLHAALLSPQPASEAIRQLARRVALLDSRDHLLLRVVGPLVLWTTQASFALETWRQRHGRSIPGWLEAVAELEALSSLAGYSYEHPEDVFPSIEDGEGRLRATGLAHPLLSDCVRNDVSLAEPARLAIVSGSNMSGKSTLLRAVGSNAVLAFAGGVVRAQEMSIARMSLGAAIRVLDSLEDGVSRFYAEILRIRQILDLPSPMLFLLDELLAGTNSHDRRIGAEAILKALMNRGGIGLATTHDLALASIGDSLPSTINIHFEDTIEDGRIRFDYKIRPGVVTRSNALELMRSVGLEV